MTATEGLSSTSPYLIIFTRTVGIHCAIKMDLAASWHTQEHLNKNSNENPSKYYLCQLDTNEI